MRLRDADDQHNVYVLYSDLLFNLLILFTIFVLALVLRLNAGLKVINERQCDLTKEGQANAAVERDQARHERDQARLDLLTINKADAALRETVRSAPAVAAELDKAKTALATAQQTIVKLQAEASAARETADRAAAALHAQERDSADTKLAVAQQLAIAAGANRFTGRTGSTRLCVAVDLTQAPPLYVFIDASTFGSAHSTLDGESEQEQKVRSARLLRGATTGAERFSEGQLTGLFQALHTRSSGEDSGEGRLMFSYSGRATFAASGSMDADGDMDVPRIEAQMRRAGTGEDFSNFHSKLIGTLLEKRDRLRPAEAPETIPVLDFAVDEHDHHSVHVGDATYALNQFREIVRAFGDGGIILQYKSSAGEICPEWVVNDILTPVGYTNSVPDPAELKRLRAKIQTQPKPLP